MPRPITTWPGDRPDRRRNRRRTVVLPTRTQSGRSSTSSAATRRWYAESYACSDANRAEWERCARAKAASGPRGGTGPDRAAGRGRIDRSADRGAGGLHRADHDQVARRYTEAGLAGLEDTPRPGGPKTVLTEEVSDKPSDYGARSQQTQHDVTRCHDPSDLR